MSKNIEKEPQVDFGSFESDMAAQIAELQNELRMKDIEKAALKKEKDAAVAAAAKAYKTMAETGTKGPDDRKAGTKAPDGRQTNYTKQHPDRHAAVVKVTAPTLIALKNLANNQDAIWWVAKHVEALSLGEKPDWHKSYKEWAKQYKGQAIYTYKNSDTAPAAGAN